MTNSLPTKNLPTLLGSSLYCLITVSVLPCKTNKSKPVTVTPTFPSLPKYYINLLSFVTLTIKYTS